MPPPSLSNPVVLSAWRDFAELLKRLPVADAARRRAEAAAEVRSAAAFTGADADAAIKRLLAAVAGLRATTARKPGERRGTRGGVYVVREGRVVEGGEGATTARAVGAGRLTPDEAYRKHRDLVKRQHFGRDVGGWGGVF